MGKSELRDFSQAKYTAIVSDLHLCEAEPLHPQFPLWKKYKTREFFFDEAFSDFLKYITQMAGNDKVELVLNGDIFDFDSVLTQPVDPIYRVNWLEKIRGLNPEEEKSLFKFEQILSDHKVWVEALSRYLALGHRAVFVIGNHDLELHWPRLQALLTRRLNLTEETRPNLRFTEWFYISNKDTLIEHGNQYDPYCVCPNPISPYVLSFNRVSLRLPFGNIACRYLTNGMGFFNPHVDTNYVMTLGEYARFFVRYMAKAQPLIIWTWLWSSILTLVRSLADTLKPSLTDPLEIENRIEEIAAKSNATPRMVRELKEIFEPSATLDPVAVARELWLDRAFLILIALFILFECMLAIQNLFAISIFWMFIPIILLLPFFMFYSRTVRSRVTEYKEPRERILGISGRITQVSRVVYGHTHILRHEIIGAIEHLNSGSWSPAFLDVECTKPIGQKTFVWIHPSSNTSAREARVYHFQGGRSVHAFHGRRSKLSRVR